MHGWAIAASILAVMALTFAAERIENTVVWGVGGLLCAFAYVVVRIRAGWRWELEHPVQTLWAWATAGCFIALLLLGGDIDEPTAFGVAIAGFALLFVGWCCRLAKAWGSWWAVGLWICGMGVALSMRWFAPVSVSVLAWLALLFYGLWVWPGLYDWQRDPG